MKNINYIINGVLALAVVILFVLQFTGKKESGVTKTFTAEESASGLLPIAYVNVDSLLLNYNYSKDLNEIIIKKQENSRASVNQKLRSLQTEMQDFLYLHAKKEYCIPALPILSDNVLSQVQSSIHVHIIGLDYPKSLQDILLKLLA